MAAKKPRKPEFNTPKATFSYPKLLVPDTKFNAKGVLSVKLVLDSAAVDTIRKNAEPIMAEYIKADLASAKKALADAPKNPKLKKAVEERVKANDEGFHLSIDDQTDAEGAATGMQLVTFKQTAKFEISEKDGSKREVEATIPLFDAKGNRIVTHDKDGRLLSNAIRVFGGTVGKVRYQIIPAYIASSGTYHASLRPIAVQIIELVSGGGDRNAEGFGFESEDGGFETETSTNSFNGPTEGAGAVSGQNDATGY